MHLHMQIRCSRHSLVIGSNSDFATDVKVYVPCIFIFLPNSTLHRPQLWMFLQSKFFHTYFLHTGRYKVKRCNMYLAGRIHANLQNFHCTLAQLSGFTESEQLHKYCVSSRGILEMSRVPVCTFHHWRRLCCLVSKLSQLVFTNTSRSVYLVP